MTSGVVIPSEVLLFFGIILAALFFVVVVATVVRLFYILLRLYFQVMKKIVEMFRVITLNLQIVFGVFGICI